MRTFLADVRTWCLLYGPLFEALPSFALVRHAGQALRRRRYFTVSRLAGPRRALASSRMVAYLSSCRAPRTPLTCRGLDPRVTAWAQGQSRRLDPFDHRARLHGGATFISRRSSSSRRPRRAQEPRPRRPYTRGGGAAVGVVDAAAAPPSGALRASSTRRADPRRTTLLATARSTSAIQRFNRPEAAAGAIFFPETTPRLFLPGRGPIATPLSWRNPVQRRQTRWARWCGEF